MSSTLCRKTLAIIGSGPSCIYLLKHLLDRVDHAVKELASIEIFEKRRIAGMGMPYHPETTDRENMSNISSEEIPVLPVSFAGWLRGLDERHLGEFGIDPRDVTESEIYPRLALGEYLHAQYQALMAGLSAAGLPVLERANCKILDCREIGDKIILIEDGGESYEFDRAVVATGHYWPEEDHPNAGYYTSPWPISKLLPARGKFHNYPVGTLGASLSAFDVVSSLAHHHGTVVESECGLTYHPRPGAEDFSITMHSADGQLPHLQYVQKEPLREIERHVSEAELLQLRDSQGFLRLAKYFDAVCRTVLIEAFRKDAMPEIAALLEDAKFGIEEFTEKMSSLHDYADPFAGMAAELGEAEEHQKKQIPAHWKEALDDLAYTLNFYAELLPAEDHMVLYSHFLPFLMNVIAALPLSSARILLALREAGRIEIIPGRVKVEDPAPGTTSTTVRIDHEGKKSTLEYRMFVDCSGQEPLDSGSYPFPSLVAAGAIREARAEFASPPTVKKLPDKDRAKLREEAGRKLLAIGGIAIDPGHQVIGADGSPDCRLADIAFTHTSGIRPYSYGLQACNEAARLCVERFVLGRVA
jgi:uncharacterized NAD(P)/FAD-binding protein YdhS